MVISGNWTSEADKEKVASSRTRKFSNDLTQDLQDQKGCQGKCDYQEAILKELKEGGKAEVGQVTQELD